MLCLPQLDGLVYGTVAANFDRLCTQVERSEEETEALLELIGETDDLPPLDANVEAQLADLKEKASHAATT